MVLSASAIVSYEDSGSSYTIFLRQMRFAIVGAIALLLVSTALGRAVEVARRARLARRHGAAAAGLHAAGHRASTATGTGSASARSASSRPRSSSSAWSSSGRRCSPASASSSARSSTSLVPYLVPVAAVAIGLVLLGGDLGTVLVMLCDRRRGALRRGRVVAALRVAGGLASAAAAVLVLTSANRLGRLDVWLGKDTRPLRRRPVSPSTAATPWPTAAGGASASAPAGRSGAGSRSRTTTSSSPSSARSWGCRGRWWCSALFAALALRLLPARPAHRRPVHPAGHGRA